MILKRKTCPQLPYPELTLRGIGLAALMTIFFMASNIYLGLKIGLTFASSIPAAVISMAILSRCKGSNILENNIVQTQTSVAGAQSSIIFSLPALVIIGYWQHFSFTQTTLIALAGGVLGVVFSIPLRRALVIESHLPYPEGVAAAQILKVRSKIREGEDKSLTGAVEIFSGGLLGALVHFLSNGLQIISDKFMHWIFVGSTIAIPIPMGFSLAILGSGYLIGIGIGLAIFLGLFLAWGVIVPYLMFVEPVTTNLADSAMILWQTKVRLIAAGIMSVGAIWSIIGLFKPLKEGLKTAFFTKQSTGFIAPTNQDLPPRIMIGLLIVTTIILIGAFYSFIDDGTSLSSYHITLLITCAILFTLIVGFLVTSVCGYMAGLLGSSSSPISSIAIIAIISASSLFFFVNQNINPTIDKSHFLVALAIFVTSAVLTIACIANDNLQDLNTGYLVGATPWRQEVALLIGCVIGALVTAPILELVYQAYGFVESMPRVGMDITQALAAPQAGLISVIANGIFNQTTNWNMLCLGVLMGLCFILIDIFLAKHQKTYRLPVLAVGIGLYLPPTIVTGIVAGALIGYIIEYWIKTTHPHKKIIAGANHKGVLFASGLIVGESLMGVVMAAVIVTSISQGGSDTPLSLLHLFAGNGSYESISQYLGLIVFGLSCAIFIKRIIRASNA